jgi:hypothetical protein
MIRRDRAFYFIASFLSLQGVGCARMVGGWEVHMPAIVGKEAVAWINEYVEKKGSKLILVAEGLRRLVKRSVPDVKETVNPWRIPTFESNGPICFFIIWKPHLTFGFVRGTALEDPKKLLEGSGKNFLHLKLRTVEDLKKPGLKELIVEAARLNKKEPIEGMRAKRRK